MSGSTPKKPVLNGEKKRCSDNPSVSDFCRLYKCAFKTIYGNFPSKSIPVNLTQNTSYISMENIYNVSCRRGEERPSLSSILKKLGFSVQQSDSLSSRVCRKCAIKVRNAEPSICFIREELNRPHRLFEQKPQERKSDQDKENNDGEERFKRMSKSPHGSQKQKLFKTSEEHEKSRKKLPAFGARRSLAMEPEMNDNVKNVREDFLSDEMFRNKLTTSESDVNVKPKASVKVIKFQILD